MKLGTPVLCAYLFKIVFLMDCFLNHSEVDFCFLVVFFFNFFGLVGFNLCSVRKKSDICLLFSFICLEYLCPSFHPKICPVFDGKAHFLEAVNNIDLFFNPVCQLMVHPFVRLSSF